MNLADALDDQVGRGLFQYDAAAAELHGLHEFILVFGSREDNDARALVDLRQRRQRGQPIEVGHAEVEQQYVGVQVADLFEHLAPVAGFADHLEIVFEKQQLLQAVAHNRMVVGDQKADRALPYFSCFGQVIYGGVIVSIGSASSLRPDDRRF